MVTPYRIRMLISLMKIVGNCKTVFVNSVTSHWFSHSWVHVSRINKQSTLNRTTTSMLFSLVVGVLLRCYCINTKL
jgi:hypothetical protein